MMEKQEGKLILWYHMVNCQDVKWMNHNKSQYVSTSNKVIFKETFQEKKKRYQICTFIHTQTAWLVTLKTANT